jgi:hypothetical protein
LQTLIDQLDEDMGQFLGYAQEILPDELEDLYDKIVYQMDKIMVFHGLQ